MFSNKTFNQLKVICFVLKLFLIILLKKCYDLTLCCHSLTKGRKKTKITVRRLRCNTSYPKVLALLLLISPSK